MFVWVAYWYMTDICVLESQRFGIRQNGETDLAMRRLLSLQVKARQDLLIRWFISELEEFFESSNSLTEDANISGDWEHAKEDAIIVLISKI